MTIFDGKLISGSWDNTIKIWDLSTGKELQTLNGHQGTVSCMTIFDGKLISGSWDTTIKIWVLSTGKELQTLNEHQRAITCMTILDGKLISGSYDGTIKIWDLSTGKELQTLNGHQQAISCMTNLDGKLVSGSHDGTIKIWDLSTGKELQTLNGHQDLITYMTTFDGKLISGSYDDTIKIWDFNFPSLSPYSKQVLQKGLTTLEKMPWAQYIRKPVEKLVEELHPDFKERLRQHCFKLGVPFPNSTAPILRVKTEVCVEALLDAIHDEDHHKVSSLLNYLIWINLKNAEIDEQLAKFCGTLNSAFGEPISHNQLGCSASLFQNQKEQAVVEFKQILRKKWGEDLPLLLVDLGIVSKEEYSQKLKCTPDHLPKIGICSPADLQALWNSPDFQYLQVTAEEATQDHTQLQTRAFDKKKIVSTLLDELLAAAKKKSEEITQCSVVRDDSGNVYDVPDPWIAFQGQLSDTQDTLNTQGLARKEFLEKFSPESYAKLVIKVNALIDEFRTLERKTQFVRLYAYINQWGILGVWNNLRSRGIHSLSVLLQQNSIIKPHDIFNMGK